MNNLLLDGVKAVEVSPSDIFFYVLIGVLLIAVVLLCSLFTRSKKFKVKEQQRLEKIKVDEAYKPPVIIRVQNDNKNGKKE